MEFPYSTALYFRKDSATFHLQISVPHTSHLIPPMQALSLASLFARIYAAK